MDQCPILYSDSSLIKLYNVEICVLCSAIPFPNVVDYVPYFVIYVYNLWDTTTDTDIGITLLSLESSRMLDVT